MSDKKFAKRLAEAMEKSGFTQEALAKAAGVSQPAVSRWLAGSQPALAVGIRLSTVLNVEHGWLIDGIQSSPEFTFDDGMRRRLLKARLLEGMTTADIANAAALPEQTFLAVESGGQNPHPNLIKVWMRVLNVEERFILEGRGRMFKSESRFILIAPGEISKQEEQLKQLRDEADFLNRRIERIAWEIAQSKKEHQAVAYRPCVLSRARRRAPWND